MNILPADMILFRSSPSAERRSVLIGENTIANFRGVNLSIIGKCKLILRQALKAVF